MVSNILHPDISSCLCFNDNIFKLDEINKRRKAVSVAGFSINKESNCKRVHGYEIDLKGKPVEIS